jgi:hypothetical protein
MYSGQPAKVTKLARRIDDFLTGRLVFSGIDRSRIRHVIPVLGTLTPYPRNPITAVAFDGEAQGVLTTAERRNQATVHPLKILSAEELEIIEVLSDNGRLQLAGELRAWEDSGLQDWPFKNYLYATGRQAGPNPYLAQRFREIQAWVVSRASQLILTEPGPPG